MHKKLIFLLILSVLFSNCSLFAPGPKKLNRRSLKKHPQYDIAIVPGVPFKEPEWDGAMMFRMIWAVHLYKRGYVKNLMMSGGAVYTPYVEAEIMKQYAIAMGVPAENIFIESRAEHSTENVWYGYLLAKQKGFKSIALASDPFQSKLLYRFVKKRTKGMGILPAIMDTTRTYSHKAPSIEYKHLKIENFIPITERQSFRKRMRGTQGRNINYKDTIY